MQYSNYDNELYSSHFIFELGHIYFWDGVNYKLVLKAIASYFIKS